MVGIVICVCLWVIYLRYLLAKKSIQSQTELQKHRLSLEYNAADDQVLQLEGPSSDTDQDIIDYKPEQTDENADTPTS
jgi:hypothetical protein